MQTEHFDIERDRELIESTLRDILTRESDSNGPLVSECVRYAVFSGGKRIRPLLATRVARSVAPDPYRCLDYAAAVELLHTASIIIDDLPCMDNDSLRRSRRAAHVEFGENITILAAFAMVILSIRLSRSEQQHDRIRFQEKLLDSISRRGLIAGQEKDLHKSRDIQVTLCDSLKTAPLFELASAAGLAASAIPESTASTFLAFGRAFGRAFQAKDDMDDGEPQILSLTGSVAECRFLLAQLRGEGYRVDGLHELVERMNLDRVVT